MMIFPFSASDCFLVLRIAITRPFETHEDGVCTVQCEALASLRIEFVLPNTDTQSFIVQQLIVTTCAACALSA